jgi:hypothetical protein
MSPTQRRSRFTNCTARNREPYRTVTSRYRSGGHMRSLLLWAIGIPLPIIVILWLVTGHA